MTTTTLEPIIREQPFFSGFEDKYLKLIVSCAKNVRFDEGDLVFREGDPANQFYLIREGMVAVHVMASQKGLVTVQTVGQGDILGWSWLFPPYRWHFDARTVRPTRALAFDGKCLRTKCEQDHGLGYEFLKRFTRIVVERLEATRLQLLDVYGAHS
ncbi:MAG: cyclic nucleotide-binding domain-containing protein [Verrucomicrobiota bacterium]|nr:cyclic nucleotide-binding domain-containing protein [Verrucomicrobiota bacterium]